ncbi:GPW/gp25 family protein [Anoxybacillus sp. MB8]|uniref:GPW/gp25 family protein n=1 Tax=Anoxybacillus sp. MB8 TaxID=2496850 RepID=UPI0013D77BCE|nr:GPW/gp25 family protein [Anoxybacillus sp. MB8]
MYEIRPVHEIIFDATGVQEVLQNVAFILSTMMYSCPMDRGFGWNPDLDLPIDVAKAMSASKIVQAIQENEPRAIVEEFFFEEDHMNGVLKPIVRVSVHESI